MQVFILYCPLAKLINLRPLMEMVENASKLSIVGPLIQLKAYFDGFAQPHQKSHDVIIDIFLLIVKQIFLLQRVQLLPLAWDFLWKVLSTLWVVDTEI